MISWTFCTVRSVHCVHCTLCTGADPAELDTGQSQLMTIDQSHTIFLGVPVLHHRLNCLMMASALLPCRMGRGKKWVHFLLCRESEENIKRDRVNICNPSSPTKAICYLIFIYFFNKHALDVTQKWCNGSSRSHLFGLIFHHSFACSLNDSSVSPFVYSFVQYFEFLFAQLSDLLFIRPFISFCLSLFIRPSVSPPQKNKYYSSFETFNSPCKVSSFPQYCMP